MQFDRTISPDDPMMTASVDAYFRTTQSAVDCIIKGLADNGQTPQDMQSVLDFGCGYGRVYRAFPALFPNARLTAADLMAGAVRFCSETFGGTEVQSTEDFNLSLEDSFDLIWLGSVFTHLPLMGWQNLLRFLADHTRSGGTVIFTTHGASAITHLENVVLKRNPYLIDATAFENMKQTLPEKGFDFIANGGGNFRYQKKIGMDITEGLYGFSFTTREWVENFLSNCEDWKLISYAAPGWAGNHDTVNLRRKP